MTLPDTWTYRSVEELIDSLEAGVSVNSKDLPASSNNKGILKTSCVTTGIFNPSENKTIIDEEVSRACVNPKAGTIIMSRMNTPALVGASAYVDKDYDNLFLPDRLWLLSAKRKETCMRWLSYHLGNPRIRSRLSGMATGTSGSMKNITKDSVLSLEVPTPPLPEQKKIAEILATWDRGIEILNLLIQKKTVVLQCIINSLFVPDRKPLIRGAKKEDWNILPISELAELNPSQIKESEANSELSFYYIDLSSVNTGRINYPNETILFKNAPSRARRILYENDILISNVRLRGFAIHTAKTDKIMVCSTGFSVLRPKQIEFRDLIYFSFFSLEISRQISTLITGSNYPAINSTEVSNLTAYFPTCKIEAQKIGELLNKENYLITNLIKLQELLRKQKQSLMQKLLTGKIQVKL